MYSKLKPKHKFKKDNVQTQPAEYLCSIYDQLLPDWHLVLRFATFYSDHKLNYHHTLNRKTLYKLYSKKLSHANRKLSPTFYILPTDFQSNSPIEKYISSWSLYLFLSNRRNMAVVKLVPLVLSLLHKWTPHNKKLTDPKLQTLPSLWKILAIKECMNRKEKSKNKDTALD